MTVVEALTQAVRTFLSEEHDPDAAIREALVVGGLSAVPTDAGEVRSFVLGPLKRVLVERRGARRFALEAVRVAREMSEIASQQRPTFPEPRPSGSLTRVGVVVTLDQAIFDKLRASVGERAELRHARYFLDLPPLSALRKKTLTTLIVHVDTSPISLTTLARVTHVLPSECRVVLAGVSERALAQLTRLYPAIERWERKDTMEEAIASM